MVGNGRSVAMLSPGASVQWWCAPEFDDPPLCWSLLDPSGGAARFPDLQLVEVDDTPAAVSATTLLRDDHGLIEIRDSVLPRGDGVLLVRLLRRRKEATPHVTGEVLHELRLGGFDVEPGDIGENVTTRGVDLLALPTGTLLHLGDHATVRITGLRNPCVQLDGFQPGLMQATLDRDADGSLVRKAGVMGVVVAGGVVRRGDPIRVELPASPHTPLDKV